MKGLQLYFYLKNFCPLCVYGVFIAAKNEGKLSTSQLIMVHHEKIADPFFLNQMGWIKPKNYFTLLSL